MSKSAMNMHKRVAISGNKAANCLKKGGKVSADAKCSTKDSNKKK